MFKNLDIAAIYALIILPITMITLGIFYIFSHSLCLFEILMFISGYYISNITVGIGLHRLWSHDSYKTNKYVEFILVMLSAGTLQGPALSWTSNHFKHHTYTDTKRDPHTPLKYKNRAKGFFWSHMGWMLVGNGSYKSIDRVTMVKLGRNKLLRWQLKYYWQLAILMNTAIPALIGYIFGGTLLSAYTGFLFIGLGRAFQQQITFFVNSLCHFVGTQKYVKSTAGDVWWLAMLLLGENWHNFHHAFPSDYRNGAKWYQMDVHKWIIYLMSKCGLAWDLKTTTKTRINAKVTQTFEQLKKLRKEKLELLQVKVNDWAATCNKKLLEIENSSAEVQEKLKESFIKSQKNLLNLGSQLNQQLKNFEDSSEKIVSNIAEKVTKAEININKLYQEFEHKRAFPS